MPGVFSTFLTETNFSDKRFILIVATIYAILCPSVIGIAIWFKEPILDCKSLEDPNLPIFRCTQETACQTGKYNYTIDYEASSLSIATEMEMVCSNYSLKRVLLSAYFFGGVIGCLINFLVYIPAKWRKLALSFLGFIHAFAHFGILLTVGNLSLLAFFFALMSCTWVILHPYCFMILNETFSGDLAKSSTFLIMLSWSVFGIIYALIGYMFNAYYYLLFFVNGSVCGVASFLLLTHIQTRPLKPLNRPQKNVFEFLKEMWNYKQICYNVITYCIVWSTFAVTYNNVFIKLETVGGNMYFNTILLLIFEMSASFAAGLIIMRFNILKSLKSFMFFEILLGLSFIMAPIQVQKDLPLSQALSLLAILVATKFFSDLVNNLINLYAPKVFTDDFIGMFLIMSRLSSRIFLMVLPSINFLFESIPLHPFLCLSILWGICRLMTNYTAEIMEEGIEDVLNEFKVDLTTRVSIMQNAEYLDVEDVLSNVVVEDVKLSTIRASRKNSSYHINISRAHSTENNHLTQMELKESLFKKTQTLEN